MLYTKLALLTTLISLVASAPQDTTINAKEAIFQDGQKNNVILDSKTMNVAMEEHNVIDEHEDLGDELAVIALEDALHPRHRHLGGFTTVEEEVLANGVTHRELLDDHILRHDLNDIREEDRLVKDLARLEDGGDKIKIVNDDE